jgi:hypothetical protein
MVAEEGIALDAVLASLEAEAAKVGEDLRRIQAELGRLQVTLGNARVVVDRATAIGLADVVCDVADCGAPMVLRVNRSNGFRFLGCSEWRPNGKGCPGSMDLDSFLEKVGRPS